MIWLLSTMGSLAASNTQSERFAEKGAGSVKQLQGVDPPEFRLRVGDYRVRFHMHHETILILRVRNRKDAYR